MKSIRSEHHDSQILNVIIYYNNENDNSSITVNHIKPLYTSENMIQRTKELALKSNLTTKKLKDGYKGRHVSILIILVKVK